MKKSNSPLILLFVLLIFISFSEALCSEIEIKINEPPHDGVEVRRTYTVKGTASFPKGYHLWVLARRADFEGVWWPQSEGTVDPVSKTWEVSVHIGASDDIGWDFDLAVIVVGDSQNAQLNDYRRKAMKTGDWRPIEMPKLLASPVLFKVKKTGH